LRGSVRSERPGQGWPRSVRLLLRAPPDPLAFPVPLPIRRLTRVLTAAVVMAVIVRGLDSALTGSDRGALVILLPAGIASYLLMCWLLDIARTRQRLLQGLLIVRKTLVH